MIKISEAKKSKVIVYLDGNNKETDVLVSEFNINGDLISFITSNNKITIPLSRLIKIKEVKEWI